MESENEALPPAGVSSDEEFQVSGKISDELALGQLPGINSKEEMDRRAADEETEFKKAMADNEALKSQLAELETDQITGEAE